MVVLPASRASRPRVLALAAALAAAVLSLASASAAASERVDIVLDPAALPAPDRERHGDRRQSMADAVASGLPLWRSFDAREVLHESLAALAASGVDLGESAIVNFDSLEADVPAGARAALRALPFVRDVRDPMVATPSGSADSEGLEVIASDLANAAGYTGVGVKVAILDNDWESLGATITEGDLPAIPVSLQFKVPAGVAGNITSGATINQLGDREHGTAAAEVVHEVAPGATLLLYQLAYSAPGGLTSASVKRAIRHAADQGAQVILVPLHFLATMSDPRGPAQGGNNLFTDDIAYAKAAGATVVVAAGNEALRHYEAQFAPCTDCNPEVLCNEAEDDSDYHSFEGVDAPFNDLYLESDYDDFAFNNYDAVKVTCYSATDAVTPANFKFELYRYNDDYNAPNPPDYPICPRDPGADRVVQVDLGGSFSRTLAFYGETFDNYYFLAVRRAAGNETPNFRINCTVAIGEFTYATPEMSLSDLAVVDDSLAVSAGGYPSYDSILETSSIGPSANPSGPMKPDLIAPGEVTNFAVLDHGFVFAETFNGTSAAAAHVAGVVALLQSYQSAMGLPPFTPDDVKQVLFASAIELDDGDPLLVGPDPLYGHGLVQVPALLLPGSTPDATRDDWDGDQKADPANFVAGNGNWAWLGSTAGEDTLPGFGAGLQPVPGDYDGDSIADAAVYDPATGDWQFSGSSTAIPAIDGFGGPGFRAVPGDWDGDGTIDPAVYEVATGDWLYRGSTSGPGEIEGFGGGAVAPVPGDWDGDGTFDPAHYADGQWAYLGSTSGAVQLTFGAGGGRFVPVAADYDGDGRMDAALYQKKKGKWRLRFSSMGGLVQSFTGFGGAGFAAVPADFDADGKVDPAIYRTTNGNWRYRSSDTGQFVTIGAFGGPGFRAVVGLRP